MPWPPAVSVVWMAGVSRAAVFSNGIVGVAARSEMAVFSAARVLLAHGARPVGTGTRLVRPVMERRPLAPAARHAAPCAPESATPNIWRCSCSSQFAVRSKTDLPGRPQAHLTVNNVSFRVADPAGGDGKHYPVTQVYLRSRLRR